MDENRLTRYGAFAAWEYEKELEEMNQLSEQGWQLMRGKLLCRIYRKQEGIVYRYQLDFPGKIEDFSQYLELFREQGWEFVSKTCNGWYYFRKEYDPSLPESEYEIFTDRKSLSNMKSMWSVFPILLCVVMGLLLLADIAMLIWLPSLRHTVLLLPKLLMFSVLLYGIFKMHSHGTSKRIGANRWPFSLLGIGCALCFASILIPGVDADTVMKAEQYAPITESVEWTGFTVRVSDVYYLDLDVDAETEISYTIYNEQNEEVFSVRGADMEVEHQRLRLERGTYRVVLSDFAGGELEMEMDIQ